MNIEGRLGEKLKAETMKQGYFQILPGYIHVMDFSFSNEKKSNGKNRYQIIESEELTAQLKELGLPAFRPSRSISGSMKNWWLL